jgi:hypothetical protein
MLNHSRRMKFKFNQHTHSEAQPTTFKVNQSHLPCEYIARFRIRRSQGKDLHIPARWKGSSNHLCASSLMQSRQVPDCYKRTAAVDAFEDEPFTTRAEIPLMTCITTWPCAFYAMQRGACVRQRSVITMGKRRNEDLSAPLVPGEKRGTTVLTCWRVPP